MAVGLPESLLEREKLMKIEMRNFSLVLLEVMFTYPDKSVMIWDITPKKETDDDDEWGVPRKVLKGK
jgi:hypothetical protein